MDEEFFLQIKNFRKELFDIKRGVKPKAKVELAKEKETFLKNLFITLQNWQKIHRKEKLVKPKQRNLAYKMYPQYKDSEKKFSEELKKYNLNFTQLWKTFRESNSEDIFIKNYC
jgi:hypothetical protein